MPPPEIIYYNFFPTTFSIQANCKVKWTGQSTPEKHYIKIPYDNSSSNNSPVISYDSKLFFPLNMYLFQKSGTQHWLIVESQSSDKTTSLYTCFTLTIEMPRNSASNDLGTLFTKIDAASNTTLTMASFDLNNVIANQSLGQLTKENTRVNVNGNVITVFTTKSLAVHGYTGNNLKSLDAEGTLLSSSIFSSIFSSGGPSLVNDGSTGTTLSAAAFTQKLSCKAVGTDDATEKGIAIPLTNDFKSVQSINVVVVVVIIITCMYYAFPRLYEIFIFPRTVDNLKKMYSYGYNRVMAHFIWFMTFVVLAAGLLLSGTILGNTDYTYGGISVLAFLFAFMKFFHDYNKKINSEDNNTPDDDINVRLPKFDPSKHFVKPVVELFFANISTNIMYGLMLIFMLMTIISAFMQKSDQPENASFIVGVCMFPIILVIHTLGNAYRVYF